MLKLRLIALGSLFILNAAKFSSAANLSASIRGTVNASGGAHVAGATVTVNNQETDVVFSTRTRSDGSYEIQLPIGVYSLTIQVPGFQTFTVFGIKLDNNTKFTQRIEVLAGKMTDNVLVPANNIANAGWLAQKLSLHPRSKFGPSLHHPETSLFP